MTENDKKNMKIGAGLLAIVLVAAVTYGAMTAPDDRTFGEKASDAAEQLDNGLDNAAREFEDRTPAERLGDSIEDVTDTQQ